MIDNNSIDNIKKLSPTEYFNILKGKKHTIDNKDLEYIYEQSLLLLDKYLITGQEIAIKKLMFHIKTLEREQEIINLGFNQFVYREDIDKYIDKISENPLRLIELSRFEREIPDDVIQKINLVKNKFDDLFILYTDYTENINSDENIKKTNIDKDPIVFGVFFNEESHTSVERFYFIADWIDEYCDLTFEKMLDQMKDKENVNINKTIDMPKTKEDLEKQLSLLESVSGDVFKYKQLITVEKEKTNLVEKEKTNLVKKEKKHKILSIIKKFFNIFKRNEY